MPCFFCGKRVSLVRQLTDADFCSDEHRKRYQELTRLALDRLLDAGQRLGTPDVHPQTEPYPEWQSSPVTTLPAYEEPVEEAAEIRPVPPREEEFQRPWRPPEPEPVFAMPPAEPGEAIPPEAFYFARLECEPQPQVFAPHAAGVVLFEPSFAAPSTSAGPGQCGMRGSLFLPGPARRAVSRALPSRLGPGGGNGFHGTLHYDRIEPDLDRTAQLPECLLTPQPLLAVHPRVVRMAASIRAVTSGGGRAVVRPTLPRFRKVGRWSAGMPEAELLPSSRPTSAPKGVQRPVAIGFVLFEPAAYVDWPVHAQPGNSVRLSGYRPLSASAVNAPARRLLEAAAEFQPFMEFSLQSELGGRGAIAGAKFADLPPVQGVARAPRPIEARGRGFARSAMLPAFRSRAAAEAEAGGPPPLAPSQRTEAPQARAMAAARRWEEMAAFDTGFAELPQVAVTRPAFAIEMADFESAAASKPRGGAAARTAAAILAPWPASVAEVPRLAPVRAAASLPQAESVATAVASPLRHGASGAVRSATAAFAAFAPIAPEGGTITAARRALEPATYAPSPAGASVGGRPVPAIVGAQIGRPAAQIGTPEVATGVRTASLGAGEPRFGVMPERPVAVALRPYPAVDLDFAPVACTPACSIGFGGHIEAASYSSTPYPDPRKGARTSTAATLDFAAHAALLPEAEARPAAVTLAAAEPEPQLPMARKGRLAGAVRMEAVEIEGGSDIRLIEAELKPPAAATIDAFSLQEIARPAARGATAAARVLPACEIPYRTLFPPAPAPVGAARAIPEGTDIRLGPRRPIAVTSSARLAEHPLAAPAAALLEWTAATATPPALGAPAAIRTEIGGVKARGTAQVCGWIALGATAPVIGGQSALLRPGALVTSPIERGTHLEVAPRRPAAAAALETASPFAPQDALFPAGRTVAAREALETRETIPVPPKSKLGAAAAQPPAETRFRQRYALLPEILLDATLARIASGRRLAEWPESAFPEQARRELAKPSAARTETVPVTLTAPLAMAESGIRSLGPFPLGQVGTMPPVQTKPRAMVSRRSDAGAVAFEIAAPLEPASADVMARRTLGTAPPAAGHGRSQAGAPRPTTDTVVAVSTQPVELAGAQALQFAHPLPARTFSKVAVVATKRAGKPVPAGVQAYGQESSVIEFASIQSRASGAIWPTAASSRFAHEPERPAKAGAARKADAYPATEFAVPESRKPALAGTELEMGSAPPAKAAAPAVRQDAATAQKKVRMEPVLRVHRHPSRLPVFHATVEKAHMPSGVFHVVEFEDWEDHRSVTCAPPCEATPVQPWIPATAFEARVRQALGASELAPVEPAARVGFQTAAGGHPESPFDFEIVVLSSGAQLMKMDFDAIAESAESRWRSALKSASGLFRGMLLLVCVVALGAFGSGCSGRGKSMREALQSRASIHLEHDFSKGLNGWVGAGDWTTTWKRNPAGFVGPGQLAIYKASQQLSDYHFEFLGQINGRSIGWVFRAADLQNYYATQLTITQSGNLPGAALVRYQVIGGQETGRVQIPLHIVLQSGQPIHIQEDVAGGGFTTSVEGEAVDSWTDDRLRAGGVGFFGTEDGTPSVYWIKVSNNDDFWGKLCGILAPSD